MVFPFEPMDWRFRQHLSHCYLRSFPKRQRCPYTTGKKASSHVATKGIQRQIHGIRRSTYHQSFDFTHIGSMVDRSKEKSRGEIGHEISASVKTRQKKTSINFSV